MLRCVLLSAPDQQAVHLHTHTSSIPHRALPIADKTQTAMATAATAEEEALRADDYYHDGLSSNASFTGSADFPETAHADPSTSYARLSGFARASVPTTAKRGSTTGDLQQPLLSTEQNAGERGGLIRSWSSRAARRQTDSEGAMNLGSDQLQQLTPEEAYESMRKQVGS